MTNEERQKLCADLQLIANDEIEGESWTGLKCKEAANEIERLTLALIELQQRFDSCQNQLRQALQANDFLTKENGIK